MKQNKLVIQINRPVNKVFLFVLNPKNTPLWIDSIIKEEANEKLPKLGTIYRNVNPNRVLSEYLITSFDKNKMFEMISKDNNYHVRYTLKVLNGKSTELEYFEWVSKGKLNEPFTLEILEKLKNILE